MVKITSASSRLYKAALASLALLLAGTLLYPDTYVNADWHIGPIRVSVLSVLLVVAAPSILLYMFAQRREITIRALDYLLVSFMAYIFIREVLAASQANGEALLTLEYSV